MNYKQSYIILHLKTGCTWAEVRKSYKALTQKWHPDKHENNAATKNIADEKIKDINKAYKLISNYYRKNGALPDDALNESTLQKRDPTSNPKKDTRTKQGSKTTQHSSTVDRVYQNSASLKSSPNKPIYVLSIVMLLSLGAYLLQNESDAPNYIKQEKHIDNNNLETNNSLTDRKSDTKTELKPINPLHYTPKDRLYFSYGATLSEVASIQGTPDRIEGNIWYYGKSEVHFREGKVVRWIRTAKKPLNAQLQIIKP